LHLCKPLNVWRPESFSARASQGARFRLQRTQLSQAHAIETNWRTRPDLNEPPTWKSMFSGEAGFAVATIGVDESDQLVGVGRRCV
jgi:hypothetical protein